jgi:hypothetical protein
MDDHPLEPTHARRRFPVENDEFNCGDLGVKGSLMDPEHFGP